MCPFLSGLAKCPAQRRFWVYACAPVPDNGDPNTPLKWKLSAAHGGGAIADLGSHFFDLVHYLLGDYAALSATTHIAYPERPRVGAPEHRVRVDAEDCVLKLGTATEWHLSKL